MQEITFLEFFCGEGRVWQAVRADTVGSMGIDIRYGSEFDAEGHQNAFDILTNAGMGPCP